MHFHQRGFTPLFSLKVKLTVGYFFNFDILGYSVVNEAKSANILQGMHYKPQTLLIHKIHGF